MAIDYGHGVLRDYSHTASYLWRIRSDYLEIYEWEPHHSGALSAYDATGTERRLDFTTFRPLAEKIMIGKCAFKAYAATNTVCSILSIVLAICALVFGIGFLPSLVVCLIWIVNQSVYCKEALKYSKAGNKIS